MARILGILLALAVLLYGIWPYYTVFRLDAALERPDAAALAPLVDLAAVQTAYKDRIGRTVDGLIPRGSSDGEKVVAWLAQNLTRLGDTALDQALTLEWVRGMLRHAAEQATPKRPATFIAGIDFAFFESWNRFVIRLGEVGADTTVVMTLQGLDWRVTDVAR